MKASSIDRLILGVDWLLRASCYDLNISAGLYLSCKIPQISKLGWKKPGVDIPQDIRKSNEKLGKQLDSSDRFVGGDLHETKRN